VLFPEDPMKWLPQDHLVFFVMDAVEAVGVGEFDASFRLGGVGRAAYDPVMLATLLVYAYCVGEKSSRQIEKKCSTDVAFRLVCGGGAPDHCTIARFRVRCSSALAGLLVKVLGLCVEAGMGRVGVVSVDGTKIGAPASLQRNYSREHLRRLADELVAEAGRVDEAEDAQFGDRRGDELPEVLAPGPDRVARIRRLAALKRGLEDRQGRVGQALDRIDRQEQVLISRDVEAVGRKLATARRTYQRELRDASRVRDSSRAVRVESRRRLMPVEERAAVRRAAQRVAKIEGELVEAEGGRGLKAGKRIWKANLSDPDSVAMPVRGGGFKQGFNSQIVVSDDHLILAADVWDTPTDQALFIPMMNQVVDQIGACLPGRQIGLILADAGYISHDAVVAKGPDRLIAVGRDPTRRKKPHTDPVLVAMGKRLENGTSEHETYKRRAATVETVFGNLKKTMKFTSFSRKGLQPARDEWRFLAAVFNLRRLAVTQGIALP